MSESWAAGWRPAVRLAPPWPWLKGSERNRRLMRLVDTGWRLVDTGWRLVDTGILRLWEGDAHCPEALSGRG